jgi:hypothetical protein
VTDEVRYRATQRAGLRGVGFELGLFAIYLAVVPLATRTDGGLVLWATLAAAAVLIRLALFSGPQHRGVVVTTKQVRSGRVALPLVDVVGVDVMDRRELRRWSHADEVEHESVPPGPREAVVVRLRSPEGLPYAFGMAVDDAAGLATAVEQAREVGTSTLDHLELEPLPLDARQGVDRSIAGWAIAVVAGFDVLWLVVNGWYVGATVLALVVVLRGARRRIVVDRDGIRSGRLRVRWRDTEQVRLAPVDEVRLLPRGRTSLPLWAPPWVLVVVRRGPAGASVKRRTSLVGVPRPIDVTETLARSRGSTMGGDTG